MPKTWYTQRQWDRVVGWGKVPKEYNKPKSLEGFAMSERSDVVKKIKWKSIDKDNMQFQATITYFQMDKLEAALAADEEKMSEYDEYEPRRPHQSARRRAAAAAWVARGYYIASESEEDE